MTGSTDSAIASPPLVPRAAAEALLAAIAASAPAGGVPPDLQAARHFADTLRLILFRPEVPDIAAHPDVLRDALEASARDLCRLLGSLDAADPAWAARTTALFFERLPVVRERLWRDAEAICEGDPAARSTEEVVLAYPGFLAIAHHRFAHALAALDVPLLPRLISEAAHQVTGIDIHPGATIGSPFVIDHGTGIVVGESSVIGDHVKLYQGVTLGALSVDKSLAATKRHPTIGDRVVVYANATILGGDTIVGHDSVIGGNVWLTQSVPPHSIVYHRSEVHVRDGRLEQPVLEFSI